MRPRFYKLVFLLGISLAACVAAGCGNPGTERVGEYLIRVGNRTLTVSDFNRAFEIARTAYPHNAVGASGVLTEARLRLLNQLAEELILMERAEEIGIVVSESEVEATVAKLKKDYPEGEFEQALLEYAVSYDAWKQGIRSRLIMEKVVARELGPRIEITPEDITKYYELHVQEQVDDEDSEDKTGEIDALIIKNLRREKLEEAYPPWIKELRRKYEVDINRDQWNSIIGS